MLVTFAMRFDIPKKDAIAAMSQASSVVEAMLRQCGEVVLTDRVGFEATFMAKSSIAFCRA